MKQNIKLDINYVRSKFPAFKDPMSKEWAFFENAGGSYVPDTVITRLSNFMTSTKVQPYAEYEMSKIAGENMDKATNYFAKMINAKNNEILIGGSTSINFYVLSNALKYFISAGDEVIVVCDNTKITQLTDWSAKYDIDDIVRHNWGFVCQE